MPCIYRRAALHRAGLDTEVYGRDVCTGEVDFNDTLTTGPGDLRACVSFIQRNPKHDEVATLLLANGSLCLDQMGEYSDLVIRAFQEIRQLFRDKGDATLKRMAGMLKLILDMHCHLDRYRDPAKVASEAARAGVNIIAVTNLPSHFRQGRTPVAALKNVRLSLGLHPLLAPHSASEKTLFAQLASATSYIGEVGLDFSKEGVATKTVQIESFEHVLEVIEKQGKVISIHSRGAEGSCCNV